MAPPLETDSCSIDGFGPIPVVQPKSVAELGDIVRHAAGKGDAVYPVGGRTMLDVGLPPSRPGIAVDLGSLTQVIDYPARDMTVTVEAGITIQKLQELLATENQQLPIDVPQADKATLGGTLAVNVSGPRRYGYGTLRDYVIGISVVNDEGKETKAGGRVVKNVAGYDLCKLHIGSLGTLGIITQVTLKLKPLPEENALATFGSSAADLGSLLEQLHGSRTRPVCVEVLNRSAAAEISQTIPLGAASNPWMVIVGYEGNRDSVGWQLQQIVKEIPDVLSRGLEVRVGSASAPLWHKLAACATGTPTQFMFKANVLPSATSGFCHKATSLEDILFIQAHAGNGIVIGHAPSGLTLERAQAMLMKLLEHGSAAEGNVRVLRCPSGWKKDLPIWGRPRGDTRLMREIKAKMDPRGLFNPGRFVV